MALTLNSRFAGDICIIQCAGPIILGPEATALEAALEAGLTNRFQRFVLSLAQVTRVDSIGLGLIVRFAVRLRRRSGDVRLAAPPPFLTSLFDLTQVSKFLLSYPTEDEAILSYLREPALREFPRPNGPRMLFLEGSADLCVFVRTLLDRHGYDVRTASLVPDARLLLQSEGADYILTGPGANSVQALAALKPIAPKAIALSLPADFTSLDADQAAETLLAVLGSHPAT